ncbi:MAG: hypothetical protein WAZ40_01270 [Minisyncoccia bacterium]
MGFENQVFPQAKTEESRENYEESVDGRAENVETLFQRFLKEGQANETLIRKDADLENKLRDMLKEGRMNQEDFDFLQENDLHKTMKDGFLDNSHNIEGTIRGNHVFARADFGQTTYDDKFLIKINDGNLELTEKEGRLFYDELNSISEKRIELLERINTGII